MPANRQRANSGEDGRVVPMQARIYGEGDAGGGGKNDGSTMIESLSLDITFRTSYDRPQPLGQRGADELRRNNFRLLIRSIWMNKRGARRTVIKKSIARCDMNKL